MVVLLLLLKLLLYVLFQLMTLRLFQNLLRFLLNFLLLQATIRLPHKLRPAGGGEIVSVGLRLTHGADLWVDYLVVEVQEGEVRGEEVVCRLQIPTLISCKWLQHFDTVLIQGDFTIL